MGMDVAQSIERARSRRSQTRKFFRRLQRNRPKNLDEQVATLHQEVFEEVDCLKCANCCKTTSPIFRDIDIQRIAQRLGLRPAALVEQYLQLDEEGDYVLRTDPCPFLGPDNYCAIYEDRPRACREYPHTDRKHFHQILPLTLRNTLVCPAVAKIVERLERVLE